MNNYKKLLTKVTKFFCIYLLGVFLLAATHHPTAYAACSLFSENTYCYDWCDDGCSSLGSGWPGCACVANCIGLCGNGQVLIKSSCYCCDSGEDPCAQGGGSGCFLPNTQIATPGGEKNIQDIKEGDTVVGIDTETGEKVETQVQSTYNLEREGYYEITVENPDGTEKVLKVTGEHPLFVKKRPTIESFFSTLLNKISNLFSF